MNTTGSDNLRKNFLLPADMVKKAEALAKDMNMNLSEMIRKALDEYIRKIEEEKIEKEAIEACKFFYDQDKKIANEWRNAEGKI